MSQSCRVLLVTNDKSRAETVTSLLGSRDGSFQVVHAWSLEAGTTALCAVPMDVLLLAGGCVKEGLSEVGRLCAHFKSLAIMAVVPREMERVGKQFFRAGACGYVLEEELDATTLREIVRSAMRRKRDGAAARNGASSMKGS